MSSNYVGHSFLNVEGYCWIYIERKTFKRVLCYFSTIRVHVSIVLIALLSVKNHVTCLAVRIKNVMNKDGSFNSHQRAPAWLPR